MEIIAHIYTDLPSKFGVPRQSGLVQNLTGRIVFEEKYRVKEAFKGLEDFSYLWVLWQFSGVCKDSDAEDSWSPSVKPPRLGGKTKMGVFATRSPFRPNHIGLSSVKLEKIEYDRELGPVLLVSGIDMMDGTYQAISGICRFPSGCRKRICTGNRRCSSAGRISRSSDAEHSTGKKRRYSGNTGTGSQTCLSRLSGACVRRGIRRI